MGIMNKIEMTGIIDNGKIIYTSPGWKDKFERLKKANEMMNVIVTVEVVDTPAHFLHKYFHGYLLPAIALYQGEVSEAKLKLELKKEFLYIPINGDLKGIQYKHSKRCNIYVKEIIQDGEVKAYVEGYTPSTGDITHKEMKEFIVKCENRLFVDLGGALKVEGQDQAAEYRKNGMNDGIISTGEKVENKDNVMWGEL